MIFNGQARRSRPINMGNRQKSTREDALKKASVERLNRQEARRKADAAARIVAAWRALKDRLRTQRSVRDSYLAGNYRPESGFGDIELDFAYFIPRLFEIPTQEAVGCLQILVQNQTRFSPVLLNSFQAIWDHRPCAKELIDLAGQSLAKFPPETLVPLAQLGSLMRLLMEFGLPSSLTSLLQLVIEQHPTETLRELLLHPNLVPHFSSKMLQPLVPIKTLPPLNCNNINAWPLVVRLLEDPNSSFPLLVVVMELVPAAEIPFEYQDKLSSLCGYDLVQSLVKTLSPPTLSPFFLKLFDLIPDMKSDLLLYMTLSSPSPLHTLWAEFKSSQLYSDILNFPSRPLSNSRELDILQLSLELYSYWLMIAIDKDMFDSTRGFGRDDVLDLCTIVRNASFSVLWNDSLVKIREVLLTTLRQLYNKDTRRTFTPPDFWLMESYMENDSTVPAAHEFVESFYADAGSGMSRPKSRMLHHAPFFIQFRKRAGWFARFIQSDAGDSIQDIANGNPSVVISRESMVKDAQEAFSHGNLRHMRVTLMSNGQLEAGIDGGGLTKELLTELGEKLFKHCELDPAPFITNENHLLFPNPIFSTREAKPEEVHSMFRFLGQIIGKCLYSGVLLDVEFARFFLQKWAGDMASRNSFDDLYYLDPEFYKSLVAVYTYAGDVEDLGLDFTTTNAAGAPVNLRRNGDSIPVTSANRLEYIHAIANYRLNSSLAPQTKAFLAGLTELIPLHWLRMFNPHEIQTLISGGTDTIDVDDLQNNTIISGFPADSETVTNFWKVVRELSNEQQHKLIQFVTSTPKGPLLGFSQLTPKFCIRCSTHIPSEHETLAFLSPREIEARANQPLYDDGRLPTASTCVNLLKLPNYSSLEVLRERLIFAIESNAGFDLS